MDFLEKMMMHHVLASHGVVLVLAAALARIDHIIAFLLKFMPASQIGAAIDKAAAAAKAEVDKVAHQDQPKP